MLTPTLRQLEYIVAIADTGQFVEAARQCAVSQPALSRQVREVEELLGVVIFERARPRVIVTRSGKEIVDRARSLLADARDLVEAAHVLSGTQRGVVRLGVIPTIAPYGLSGCLAKLRDLYPEVSFAIHELQTDVLLEKLRGGEIDVGLLARSFDDTGLTGVDLVDEPFVLVAPAGHALASPSSIAQGEIFGAELILMEDGHCLRDQAVDLCAVAGRASAMTVSAASVSTLTRMVESGLGATLLPASALQTEVRAGQGLVARAFDAPAPGRTITLQWRATSPKSAWFERIGEVIEAHYLQMNTSIDMIFGGAPEISRASRT